MLSRRMGKFHKLQNNHIDRGDREDLLEFGTWDRNVKCFIKEEQFHKCPISQAIESHPHELSDNEYMIPRPCPNVELQMTNHSELSQERNSAAGPGSKLYSVKYSQHLWSFSINE